MRDYFLSENTIIMTFDHLSVINSLSSRYFALGNISAACSTHTLITLSDLPHTAYSSLCRGGKIKLRQRFKSHMSNKIEVGLFENKYIVVNYESGLKIHAKNVK